MTQQPVNIGPIPRVVRLEDKSEWIGLAIVAAMAVALLGIFVRRMK